MRVPGKNVMLGGLMGLWATVAAVQVSSLPEGSTTDDDQQRRTEKTG
ncbi:MAG: hypothetical protein KF848_08405 [Nitrospira sp.]|nr:hypothetical protein [Nitrospira sp.]